MLADGSQLNRSALFVDAAVRQRSDLAIQLGCRILDDGAVEINDLGQTSVHGVYAGDMARRPTMPEAGAQVVVAAAEGTIAAVVIDQELLCTNPT